MNKKVLALFSGLFLCVFCTSATAQVEQVYSNIVTDETAFVEELDAWFKSPDVKNPQTISLLRTVVNGESAITHNLVLDYADYDKWDASMDAAYKSNDFAKMQRRLSGVATGNIEALYLLVTDNGRSAEEGDYIFVVAVEVATGGDEAYVAAINEYMNTDLAKKAPGFIRLLACRAGADYTHLVIFSAPTFAAVNKFLDAHSGSKEMEDFVSKVEGISNATGTSIHKVIKVWK
jgi:hypothetical protein